MTLPGPCRGGLAVLLLSTLAACGPGGGRDGDRPPDVVLVVVDTLRADHLSLYGHDRPTSPRLDAWASGGAVFERARSPSSWTVPSMAMLLTGELRSDNRGLISSGTPTLAERFSEAGYATAAVVANKLLEPARGWGAGFDRYVHYGERIRGPFVGWKGDEVVARALEAVDAVPSDRPLFLLVMLFDPHQPFVPDETPFPARESEARRARFEAALAGPGARLEPEAYRTIEAGHALYEAEVRQADEAFGALLEGLDARGRLEGALVAFTADHGEGLWERATPPDVHEAELQPIPGLYWGHGVTLHEEQVRVPLVLAGPGVPSGARIATPVSTVDLAPTLAALAGLEFDGGDGAYLFGAELADRREQVAFNSRGSTLTVDGRWRLHLPTARRRAEFGLEPELFDLLEDPEETRPVDDPERIAALTARLEELAARFDRSAQAPAEAADRELLERLGYTEGQADAR